MAATEARRCQTEGLWVLYSLNVVFTCVGGSGPGAATFTRPLP